MAKTGAFDSFSDDYDRWFVENVDIYHAELDAVGQLLPKTGEGLEVGVGSGKFSAPFGIKTGVEPSEKMAKKAQELGITVYSGVAENLPFEDESFDFVLMVTTICFVDNVEKSLHEIFRVLKPAGCIIVGYVDKESVLGKQYQDRREYSKFYKDATFYSTTEVISYLQKTGFKIDKLKQTIIFGESVHIVQDGYGKGSFIALKAKKM